MTNLAKQIKQFHKHPEVPHPIKRRINMWYQLFKEPPVDALSANSEYYVGLWIKPWFNRKKCTPPLRIFLTMLDKLSQMYIHWDAAFSQNDQAYDLQIWLYDEHMMDSQLVCAAVEKHGDRRTNYFHPCPEQYSFQTHKYIKYGAFDPKDFEWTTYEVRDYLYEEIDKLTAKDINKLLKRDWHEEVYKPGTDEEQKCYWQIYDFVWVGRRKLKSEN